MRKKLTIAAAALVVLIAGAIALWPRPAPAPAAPAFELGSVGPGEVTLGWRTATRSRAAVAFAQVGTDAEPTVITENPPATEKHRLVLRGLEPATRYRYGLAGGVLGHEFETQPLPSTPFSFLLVWGAPDERFAALARSESAAFVLSVTPIPSGDPDPYRELRPAVALFGPTGPDSRVFEQPTADHFGIDWGGLRLLVMGDLSELEPLLEDRSPHTIGIVSREPGADLAELEQSERHATIARYNRDHGSHPVSFVLLVGAEGGPTEVDDVVYLGLPIEREGKALAGAARLDVAPDSTVMRLLGGGVEVTLRKPPLRRWRTCKECRELADRGAYEQSVRAYQEFIAQNQGHYQIDDAHYAVAQLLDERLFRFADALGWYRTLVESYPESTLVPLARQRIAFLTARADHDFEPLARFERIRKQELARHRRSPEERARLLAEVASIVTEFPASSLGPEIRYWLANQHRQQDPDRAVALYRDLIAKHASHGLVGDARIEIGETYYAARRYREAENAYREALRADPARADAIEPQIKRSLRNQRRTTLAMAGWAWLALLLAPVAAWPPRGLSRREVGRASKALLALAPLTLLGAWLIHEQFSSRAELFGLALAAPIAACLGYPVTASLGRKLACAREEDPRAGRRLVAAVVGSLLALVTVLAASYLAIYHFNEHYLTAFGL